MKHKHYDMIVAKAANMDLVIFGRYESKSTQWEAVSYQHLIGHENYEHFLCLPQHNEACLHWLNGGEVQQSPVDENFWVTSADVNKVTWMPWTSFMKEDLRFRIKPKKEKRIIGVHLDGRTTSHYAIDDEGCYAVDEIRITGRGNPDEWQFIEIEVEV